MVVLDLKTSSQVYPEHFLQVGAYALALRAEGVAVERGLVLSPGGRAQAGGGPLGGGGGGLPGPPPGPRLPEGVQPLSTRLYHTFRASRSPLTTARLPSG